MKHIFVGLFLSILFNSGYALVYPGNSDGQQEDKNEWRQLFNGKDLDGWVHVGDGFMTVEDGLIKTHGGMGLLYWKGAKFGNCTFRVVFRMQDENSNSGFFIRIPIEPKEAWMPVYYGFEVQVDNHPETSGEDEYHSTGMLYAFTKPLEIAWKPGPEWNTFEVTLDRDRTIVYLNGVKVTDYKEGDPVPIQQGCPPDASGESQGQYRFFKGEI